MPDTVRSVLETATGLDLSAVESIHVELPDAITVGDSASALGAAIASIYPGTAIPSGAALVFETDSRAMDDELLVPGAVTVDSFDGAAGSVPSSAIWGYVNGVTCDGAGNALFDQSTAVSRGLRLFSTEPLAAQAWRAEFAQVGNSGSGNRSFTVAVTRLNDPRFGFSFVQAGGGLQCRVQDSSHGSTQLAVPAWNATTMRHQRIRVTGGQVVFETSADNAAWTQRASAIAPAWLSSEPCRYDLGSWVSASGVSPDAVKLAAAALA